MGSNPFLSVFNLYNNLKKFMNKKIRIKIESLTKLSHRKQIQNNPLNILNQALFYNLNFSYFILRKKKLITILSSPHVHKKAREQFYLKYYQIYYSYNILNYEQNTKFIQFLNKFKQLNSNQGVFFSIIYHEKINLCGYLFKY
jgi:ribosomal protein S10